MHLTVINLIMANEHVLFVIDSTMEPSSKHLICKRATQEFTIFTNLDELCPSGTTKSLV